MGQQPSHNVVVQIGGRGGVGRLTDVGTPCYALPSPDLPYTGRRAPRGVRIHPGARAGAPAAHPNSRRPVPRHEPGAATTKGGRRAQKTRRGDSGRGAPRGHRRRLGQHGRRRRLLTRGPRGSARPALARTSVQRVPAHRGPARAHSALSCPPRCRAARPGARHGRGHGNQDVAHRPTPPAFAAQPRRQGPRKPGCAPAPMCLYTRQAAHIHGRDRPTTRRPPSAESAPKRYSTSRFPRASPSSRFAWASLTTPDS